MASFSPTTRPNLSFYTSLSNFCFSIFFWFELKIESIKTKWNVRFQFPINQNFRFCLKLKVLKVNGARKRAISYRSRKHLCHRKCKSKFSKNKKNKTSLITVSKNSNIFCVVFYFSKISSSSRPFCSLERRRETRTLGQLKSEHVKTLWSIDDNQTHNHDACWNGRGSKVNLYDIWQTWVIASFSRIFCLFVLFSSSISINCPNFLYIYIYIYTHSASRLLHSLRTKSIIKTQFQYEVKKS